MNGANRNFWEELGAAYSRKWESRGQRLLSKWEMEFINKNVRGEGQILDIGCGNGRVIDFLSRSTGKDTSIMGVDIANSMVAFCKNRFALDHKVKELKVCDVSQEEIPFSNLFDVITCIRVLKYSANWRTIIARLRAHLKRGGTLLLEMPNKHSVTRFAPQDLPTYHTSFDELEALLTSEGFEKITMSGISKLPEVVYTISRWKASEMSLSMAEKCLNATMGKRFLARLIFVKCNNPG